MDSEEQLSDTQQMRSSTERLRMDKMSLIENLTQNLVTENSPTRVRQSQK